MSTGDRPIEVSAVQQVPGLAGSKYVPQGSSGSLDFPPEADSMQAS